jgi:uncharacterized protein (DUF2237 family)
MQRILPWLAGGLCAVLVPAAMAASSGRKNVLGTPLRTCCLQPKTGFARDGLCRAIDSDHGTHTVCAVVTQDFLKFTQARGNDLQTPRPEHDFPGLKAGDRWCLCVLRWREALQNQVAPPVVLASTDARSLDFVALAELQAHAAL